MVKKILFFDYDGTIQSDQTMMVSSKTVEILNNLKEKGYILFLNTGRTNVIVKDDIRCLPFDGYILGCGSYVEYHGEVLKRDCIDENNKDAIIEKIHTCDIEAFFEGHDHLYKTKVMKDERMVSIVNIHTGNGVEILDVKYMKNDFAKMFIHFNDASRQKEFIEFISKYLDCIDRGYPYMEIILKKHSKGSGIQFVVDTLGINLKDCYVFGDSNNDISMFELVENSALLCNGIEQREDSELKHMVKYVCNDVDHDGLLEAVHKFQLL